MDISWPLLLLIFFLAWMVLVRIHEAVWKYPPSCIGFPVLGRLPMMAFRATMNKSNFFSELSRDGISQGDVWSSFIGMRRIVGLTSFDVIVDALSRQGHDFAWRPSLGGLTEHRLIAGEPARIGGIGMSSGDLWREHRRFALSVMRDLGMGRNVTEQKIKTEAMCLRKELGALGGAPVAPNHILTKSVSNIISQFVFGIRSTNDNYEFEDFNRSMKQILQEGDVGTFLTFIFPALENTFVTKMFGQNYANLEKKMIDFIADKVSEAEARMSKDNCAAPEHFVEAFLRKQASEPATSSFCRQQLVLSVYDLFAAGSETTSTFLNWAVIYLSVHRDWQKALQEEIDTELGSLNDISYGDRTRCHKTLAFIDEVHRHASITPHGVPHSVGKECFFRGFRIPQSALIISDLISVHFDPELWPDPERFDPGRHLKDSGEYQASKFLIPFSVGKRACLGESLARMEIFLFLAAIVKSFEVDLDDEAKALKDEVFVGNNILDINAPKDHKVIFTARME